MSRRWKVIWAFNLMFVLLGFLALTTPDLRWPILFHFMGYITGLVIYSGALDAEEREKAEWKFQDKVYTMYEDALMNKWTEERAINETAVYYDTTPSNVRRIVKIYEG